MKLPRPKLSRKDLTLMKLVIWVCFLVWMVFFMIQSVIVADILSKLTLDVFSGSSWGNLMNWVLPIWYIFTCSIIVILIARWVRRKFINKEGINGK